MLTRWRRHDEAGSGTTIAVAIIFPMLMLFIVVLQALTQSARVEQALQATANRAAHTASLCCYHTGGPNGAQEVVHASLRAAESARSYNRVLCNNDFIGDSRTIFIDVGGNEVSVGPDQAAPPGGTVYVFLRCVIPPQHLGGFALPGLTAERRVVGTASVDPYRFRPGS